MSERFIEALKARGCTGNITTGANGSSLNIGYYRGPEENGGVLSKSISINAILPGNISDDNVTAALEALNQIMSIVTSASA